VRENFVASDIYALLPVTQRFVFLEEGDIAEVTRDAVNIYDPDGRRVTRPETLSNLSSEAADKGGYKHFMLKEIFEQASAVSETLGGRN
jgi:glucosamine--fructose-6-phosphate aminotransferase (isomerizing)